MSVDPDTYEARFGPVARRFQRALRACRWTLKGISRRPRTVLIDLRWRLGDEIMALPVYSAIKRAHPDCRIVVHCSFPDLLVDNPFVDAVNIPAHPDRYANLRGGPRERVRIYHYARAARIDTPDETPALYYRDWSTPLLDELRGAPRPWVAVSTGASWPVKRWERTKWLEVVEVMQARGATVFQAGSGKDEQLGLQYDFVNRTTVREAACLLHAADGFLGCDSGLLHLALAAGIPAAALFGPTDPTILIPGDPRLTAIPNGRPCFGCWNVSRRMTTEGVCPLSIADCLGTIDPSMVLSAIGLESAAKD
ncbi:MAG: hypothetical protein AMXMBFR84_03470 [Candidatus Hydrogenedentota bacterium]